MANPPPSDPGVRLLTDAYIQLRTCRRFSVMVASGKEGGVGSFTIPEAIPWDKMLTWCRWHRFDRETANHAIRVLMMVDSQMRRKMIDEARSKRK